ncbi:hypothetical protein BOX15_Mlig019503g2 [Macrostomum lignano]|uniref:NADH dehydrogenase [ubiquinone] 1 beta subcomplex subunit 8, mitochondrial n=1 Tax=Macrostomum lignano TaxID=282301 RepID=A0A267FTD1_9PLAT|nr:hypothetical protein BOX15_Mlig019503g4 [Macrostomum lignano]PAA85856.1 hypothetical protein BOX15_Mlig019503g2 [Macrostomum lignano]
MSASLKVLAKGPCFSSGLFKHKILRLVSPTVVARSASYWDHDWQPGPYPRTKEERDRAAKRYGLLPEDYEPFPDDGNAPGDYPNLPAYSAHHRDLFANYEHRQLTRHYGEPMHINAELYRLGFVDPNNADYWHWRMPYWKQLLLLVTAVASVFGLLSIGNRYRYFPPVMAKQFPYDKKGQKHYLFEPADE